MPSNRKSGRPKVTEKADVVSLLVSAFRDGLTVRQACIQSGISHEAYYRRCREDRQALSIEKQDKQVQQIFARHGLTPIYLPAEEQSAKRPGRPIFNDMMDRIERGEAQNIAIWVLSRLSRNPVDGGRVIYALDTGKLHAIYTPGKVYRNTANDKMILAIELAIAKKNNDDLSDQVKEGFETKRSRGQYPGPAPIGYINTIVGPGERNIAPHP